MINHLRTAVGWVQLGAGAACFGTISVVGGALTRRRGVGQWCMRQWCARSLHVLGIEVVMRNAHLLNYERPCVYVANHLSDLDVLVIGSQLGGDYRWLAKSSLFKIPFLGWHLSQGGHVPVYRGKDKHKNEQLERRLREVTAQGASIFFFPEGTRSETGKLGRFHLGAFFTAVQQDLAVVPLVVQGTHELYSRSAKDLSTTAVRRCSLTVLPEIAPSQQGHLPRRAAALRDATRGAMQQVLSSSVVERS